VAKREYDRYDVGADWDDPDGDSEGEADYQRFGFW
jgi:hypothetical protein